MLTGDEHQQLMADFHPMRHLKFLEKQLGRRENFLFYVLKMTKQNKTKKKQCYWSTDLHVHSSHHLYPPRKMLIGHVYLIIPIIPDRLNSSTSLFSRTTFSSVIHPLLLHHIGLGFDFRLCFYDSTAYVPKNPNFVPIHCLGFSFFFFFFYITMSEYQICSTLL